ncbi:Delta-3,5-Delta-2,4-dienoyl-CoA isomerase, mitochondrial [Halotydeus destructor]|nr:Delta-3,5-Delta-2,4-dienoyl-CoA isomerase, mitochondrial [Halotydeus destructor]
MSQAFFARSSALMASRCPPLIGIVRHASVKSEPLAKVSFETLLLTEVAPRVLNVQLNRPDVRNAMSLTMFSELKKCFDLVSEDNYIRSVVLSGNGKTFCSGIDLMALQEGAMRHADQPEVARKAMKLKQFIREVQKPMFAIYKCRKPVVAAVHGAAVGGAIDMLGAVNIRYASKSAWFSIKEVDLGIIPDIGTLQFVPKAVGNQSLLHELLFTGRKFDCTEAKELGFINRICDSDEAVLAAAIDTATVIAAKSPVAVQGTKHCLQYCSEHTIDDSLKYQSVYNMTMLQGEDTVKATMAMMSKDSVDFEDL